MRQGGGWSSGGRGWWCWWRHEADTALATSGLKGRTSEQGMRMRRDGDLKAGLSGSAATSCVEAVSVEVCRAGEGGATEAAHLTADDGDGAVDATGAGWMVAASAQDRFTPDSLLWMSGSRTTAPRQFSSGRLFYLSTPKTFLGSDEGFAAYHQKRPSGSGKVVSGCLIWWPVAIVPD